MKQIKTYLRIILLTGILFALYPIQAQAGRYSTCNGDPVVLKGDPTTRISTVSFPVDSTSRADLNNSITHWNNLRGMSLEFEAVDDDSNSYAFDNGRNEVVFQDIDGLGRAIIQKDSCFWWFESQHIQEFDIELDSGTSWDYGAPPENHNNGLPNLRYTAIHELGHALGLNHTNDDTYPSVMKQSSEGESWSGGGEFSRVHPFPDDAYTARFLYPVANRHRDIATSAFEVVASSGDATETMANTTLTRRRGQSFTVRASFGNMGTIREDFEVIFVLSTNDIISTFDTIVASGTGWVSAGGFHTFGWNAWVPNSLPAGTYSLGMIIDPNNTIPESIEENNIVLLRTKIRVVQ